MTATERLADRLDPAIVDDKPTAAPRDLRPTALIRRRQGDPSPFDGAIVRPREPSEVAQILVWARESATPVVPFGAGSGVCGAIAPDRGIVLDLRAMNEIVDFDDKSRLVRVQAGVTGPQLTAFLDERGFMLGHEPQSIAISTVGGWLATRACGQLSAKYGGIEERVAGLEAVLPNGTVVRSKIVPRRAAGPDVASLMLGSEGTLGVITQATLRVFPRPDVRADRCMLFDHMADGVQACRKVAQSDLEPTVVRLYDREDTFLFMRRENDPPEGNVLLLSFDGRDAEARADEAVDLAGGRSLEPRFVEHWWAHRNDAVEEFASVMRGEGLLGPHGVVDTMEVSGTWSVLRDLYHSMKQALTPLADFTGCHLSHVYPDGACLYFTLAAATPDDEAALAANERWWDVGMRACLDAGGSISHHHGIGRLKAPWLEEELGGWYQVLVAVKRAVDPEGIMNPGALGL
ncbi:MAG: FAD-binding oxidoreductase [Actinomycetota bacterium]|nr:FAD-binding oxidoreductase [Actinomycetota bacterium]